MKKKQALAVLLAVAMASVTSMTALAEEGGDGTTETQGDGTTETQADGETTSTGRTSESQVHDTTSDNDEDHGGSNEGEALIGPEEDFVQEDNTYQGDTQFYLKIDKDATSGTVTIPGSDDYEGEVSICHYDVEWETTRNSHISVTVPLYVCMYGYGGDGKVITPENGEYKLSNNSTYEDYRTVKSIYKCYHIENLQNKYKEVNNFTADDYPIEEQYLQVLTDSLNGLTLNDEDVSAEVATKKTVEGKDSFTLSATAVSGQYGFYSDDTNKLHVIALDKCDQHTVESSCTHASTVGYEYFYRDKTNPVTEYYDEDDYPHTVGDDDDYKLVAITGISALEDGSLPLAINVPTIKAEMSTWEIREAGATDLKEGQISMLVNNVDLYDVEQESDHSLDIKDLGWVIPALTETNGVKTLGTLPLPVKAAIAGGNVNKEGCVPVVRVTYTVSPAMDTIDNTTYPNIHMLPDESQ
jgi:hypothetical protein